MQVCRHNFELVYILCQISFGGHFILDGCGLLVCLSPKKFRANYGETKLIS